MIPTDLLRIALVAIARPTFDVPLATSVTETLARSLAAAGAQIVGAGSELVMDADAAARALDTLERETFDLLLVFQASFADSSMVQRLSELTARRKLPLLLWAVPDARDGGRLRLNSLCGINLAGHALTLLDRAYHYVLAPPDDAVALESASVLARAGRARRSLTGCRVGVVGEHPAGFETCDYDSAVLAEIFGVKVDAVALAPLLERAAACSGPEREPFLIRAAALAPNLGDLDSSAVSGTGGVHAALGALVQERAWSGLAVRCWPEFFTELGCAACGAMSLLGEDGCPASCEADVNGTVSSLLLQALSGEAAWIADLVSLDTATDTGVLWHCGLAPAAMADPEAPEGIRATVHSNRKLPLLFEFPLKPGRVTLARVHRRLPAAGRDAYELVVGGGEMLRSPRSFGGTSGVVRFDKPVSHVFDLLMRRGLEHHLCLTYGDVRAELRVLASLVGLPVLELT